MLEATTYWKCSGTKYRRVKRLMSLSTVGNAFLVLLPVLFVMALGFVAGRSRQFDPDQVQGLNELVLSFALPALLFAGIVTTSRSSLLTAGPFVLALLIVFVGLFVVVALLSMFTLHRGVGAAALQASCTARLVERRAVLEHWSDGASSPVSRSQWSSLHCWQSCWCWSVCPSRTKSRACSI